MLTVDQKPRSHRFIPRILAFVCLALGGILGASPAGAATITVPIEVSDQDLLSDGTARFVGSPSSRVGLGYGGTTPSVSVMPFKFPSLPAGQRVTSATLSINIEGWNNLSGAPLRNIDLYGIGIVSSSNFANHPEDYYVDGVAPGSNPDAHLLQDNFVTPADIAGLSGTGTTLPKSSTNFGWFIQALYDGGAQPGEYGFLTLTHDTALTLMRYYTFTSANGTTLPKPVITLVTGNVGRNYYLDAALGSDANPGSELSPWKTFGRAQPQIQPGDTLYCTGELGLIDMYSSTNVPSGKIAFRAGTAEKPVSYRAWAGKSQPHVSQLVFHGSTYSNDAVDAYLSFEKFLFSPGKVASADYDENNAINLKGASHVTFTDCDIEGASLDVPAGALAHVPLADRFTPYTPISETTRQSNPAITAGTPGNASHIRIQNCRIRNCGIGIMVADNESYYPPYRYPQQSHHWEIWDNDISTASEDGIRFAGGNAGAYSTVLGNRIHDQNYCKSALAWYGYMYRNGNRDLTAFDGKKWKRVQQLKRNGTLQTGIVYFTRLDDAADGYSQIYILADSRETPAIRSENNPWVLIEDPNIEFRPLYQDGTANEGNAANGDSSHTDAISVMGQMTGGVFGENEIAISEWGGGGLKLENLPLSNGTIPRHPTDILFRNNLFYSPKTPINGGATIIIAGGKNCWFVNNTIFSGLKFNPITNVFTACDTSIRFSVRDGHGVKKMTTEADPEGMGVHFLNNIIGLAGLTNAKNTDPEYGQRVASSDHNLWVLAPQTGTTAAGVGMSASSSDNVPGASSSRHAALARVKFVDFATNDLRLNSDSPAINLGASSFGTVEIPADDINGDARTGNPDAGAFEAVAP